MGGEGRERATNCVRTPYSFPFQTIGMVWEAKLARTVKKQTVLRDILRDGKGEWRRSKEKG